MSRFSNALEAALESQGWKQKSLCERTGLPHHRISKYVRGTAEIGEGTLELIAKQFPPAERSQIVAGWLLDHIPASAEGLIAVLAEARLKDEPDIIPPNLSPELRDALTFLANQAALHPEVRNMLVALARTLRGR